MKDNNIDNRFKSKINSDKKLPKDVKWNKEIGWEEYSKTYFKKKSFIMRRTFQLSSAAAIILILITLILINNNNSDRYITVKNNTSRIKEIVLPDGNTVWLNKNTDIHYPKKIKGEECIIKIEGEVYFEIKNKQCTKYVITAHNALVTIQGESKFNIRTYRNEENVDITVKSGIVKVQEETDKDGLALLINEGHFCSVHKSAKLVFSAENQNNNYLAWKTGIFVFDNTPIITIADLLTEYYGKNVKVENDNIAYCLLSSTFDNIPLEDILAEIKDQLKLEIKHAGNTLILSGKGC